MRPLEGVTVVSLEQAVAAPFATRQLADLGARVIKIERPGDGDFARRYDATVKGLSSHFVWLNRSKESLALDIKHEAARAVLDRLIARADVFVQNLGPGAAERLSLGSEELRARHPRLIVCDISGYGASGPYQNKKAYDLLVQSEAGLVSITGTDETPCKVGISVADIAAGMYAFSGILTALLVRGRTGSGTAIEVSLFEALGEWMGFPVYYTAYGGSAPSRTGASHAAIAPYGPFTGKDRRAVYLGLQNEREWTAFCRVVLERADLAGDPRFHSNANRVANRAALDAEIAGVFDLLTAEQIVERLERAGIANARMNTMQEFVEHPQLAARKRWRTVDSPVGPLRVLIPPATLSEVEPIMGAVPDVGDHTDAILEELGFDRADVSRWRQAGMI
jgi:crotonobetainyl-CoA:carnitine CoA-transferase CaiB-like acyl-CoA transferase